MPPGRGEEEKKRERNRSPEGLSALSARANPRCPTAPHIGRNKKKGKEGDGEPAPHLQEGGKEKPLYPSPGKKKGGDRTNLGVNQITIKTATTPILKDPWGGKENAVPRGLLNTQYS